MTDLRRTPEIYKQFKRYRDPEQDTRAPVQDVPDTLQGNRGSVLQLALLCVAQFVGVLNFQIVAIALPAIQRGLSFSQANLQWVISANALAFGGALLLAGRASDLFGHRLMYSVGMGLFALASFSCGWAPSQGFLIIARALQGLGTAIVTPAALALVMDMFAEGPVRNRAFGVWGAAGPIGGLVSMLAGGALASTFGWRWVFFVSAPIAALACVVAPYVVVERQRHHTSARLDLAGGLIGAGAVVLLVYGLTQTEQAGASAYQSWASLACSLLLLLAFIVVERSRTNPLIPLRIFRRRVLTGANLVTLAFVAVCNTPIFFFTQYMQHVKGYSPLITGLAFLPTNLAIITGAALGSRLTNRIGYRGATLIGLSASLVAMLLLARISPDSVYSRDILPGLLSLGLGLGIAQVATTIAGTTGVSAEERGLASGLLNTSAQIGTALGLALLVTVADTFTSRAAASGTTAASSAAIVLGFRAAFSVGAGLALFGAIMSWVLLREPNAD